MNQDQLALLKKHLIPALDLDDPAAALSLATKLQPYCAMVKVGLRLFTRAGFRILDDLHDRDLDVFLDLKFHDIPNTVADAVSVVAAHPAVKLLTIHASGGSHMVRAAVEAAKTTSGDRAKIIAVTALTSISDLSEIGVPHAIDRWVDLLADTAISSGVAGLVCSPLEAEQLRRQWHDRDDDLLLVTPGIRLPDDPNGDQSRIATPANAIAWGASYLVVGRPIYASLDPLQAIEKIGVSL